MAASFNLVTQPWVPVRQDDRLIEVSLRDALLRAGEFQGIEDPSPLVVGALHRFLLAVLHRALAGPQDPAQAAIWFRDGFPEGAIRDYLARYHDRFDLFDPARPFYQVPDFGPELSSRSWTILAPELNSDNNKVLFDHTVTAHPGPLRPALAARLLVANQVFALSAGKSVLCHTATAPIATAVNLLVQGETLRETLCLNLAPYTARQYARDRAAWEEEPLTVAFLGDCALARRPPVGIVDRYTWQTRAIRLHPEARDDETIVTRISYASGVRCDDPAEIGDPLVAYRRDPKDATRRYPLGFREGRALWRDFHALFPTSDRFEGAAVLGDAGALHEELTLDDGDTGRALRVLALGQANDQAKIEFWRMERYRLAPALLGDPDARELIRGCLALADETGQRLNAAARALAKRLLARGDREPHKDDIRKLVESFPHGAAYWSALEGAFAGWLAGLGPDVATRTGEHRRAWLATVDRQARDAWALTARAAGDDARALRAIFASEGLLLAYLAKQRKEAA